MGKRLQHLFLEFFTKHLLNYNDFSPLRIAQPNEISKQARTSFNC